MLSCWRRLVLVCIAIAACLLSAFASAQVPGPPPALKIPRVSQPPKLEDFETMQPTGAAAALQQVTGFIQNQPSDGKPATERTEGYIGYDDTNLYIVMVCWDDLHRGVRGSLTRREPSASLQNSSPFESDDYVEFTLRR